ncbi:hypothetical protein BU23DRAFT_445114 [Bimuria novae-zelandiae CBS 107.79]|uniref:Zn(2)-C6 fungal-type domain-containing protein n=1 Tax=Bimuria novae-zelandiae CBS 107.79 TaxID=1447943 RepID=A0A6A5VSU1_9PLEO|nr:hypothetical protein BU23DRAFT_445114 [Bimuria novae-zelandiae CBS 107.79]
MADFAPSNTVSGSAATRAVRKKAAEACERCREKRIKCNGLQPCDQCTKKVVECVFAFATLAAGGGNEALADKLDLVLSRLERIEQQMGWQASVIGNTAGEAATKPQLPPLIPQSHGVAQFNQQNGCFEYYGRTSTFVIASSLGKRIKQMEDASGSSPIAKHRRTDPNLELLASHEDSSKSLSLDELTSCCDYVVPLNAWRSDRYLRESIADRHLDSFFRTIHVFLPVLESVAFRARYSSLRKLFGDRRLVFATPDDSSRPQFVCLLYAVLALGALYEDEREDSPSWASWYFAEAQDMLGRLLDAGNLQLIQAATFLGAYAQHVIKPNLAYILTGIATRLAFSIGLNVESLHHSLGFDLQEARRTWSIIYIQEVELSLDAGRPMSLRSSEMNMNYPTVQARSRGIFKLEEREALRQQLECWRASLPNYLNFEDSIGDISDDPQSASLYNWRARQQSSLRIHYNVAIIILLRISLSRNASEYNTSSRQSLMSLHQTTCLDAARDMISHIHRSFKLAPSLRRWSYYCFYCLQATLVLLSKVADTYSCSRRERRHRDADTRSSLQPAPELDATRVEEGDRLCSLAVDIFEQIKLKASQRCADVVRQFLTQQSPMTAGLASASKPSPLSSTPVARVTNSTDETGDTAQTTDTIRGRPICTESVNNVDDSSTTSPPVSLNGLQTELYGALYSNDPNEGFYSGHHPCLFGTEGPEDGALGIGMEVGTDGSWFQRNNMHIRDHYPHEAWFIDGGRPDEHWQS